jgi:hypothetical protein
MKADVKGLGGTYAVEMWFWNGLPSDARPVTGYLFSRGADGAEGAPGDHLGIGGTALEGAKGRIIFFNGNARNQTLVGKTEVRPKTWNHVVLVRDGKRLAVHLNGAIEIEGEAEVGHPDGVRSIFVGGRSDGFANFEGKISLVAVFGEALTAKHVTAHLADLKPPFE